MGGKSGTSVPLAEGDYSGAWLAGGAFVLAWLGCWVWKIQLLVLTTAPVLSVFGREGANLVLHYRSPIELLLSFVKLCSTGALIAALPLLTRTLMLRRRPLPTGFVALSYTALALAILAVHFGAAPWLLQLPMPTPEPSLPQTIALGGIVTSLSMLHSVMAVVSQLAVLLPFAARAPSPTSPDRS